MTISFIYRQHTVDVLPTSKGYTFKHGCQTYRCRTQESVHRFFLDRFDKIDTVKLRLPHEKYYLHFTLDEPEKFSTKRQLRAIFSQECEGAWIEEKNGKQRYFIKEGWLFPKIREVTSKEFASHHSSGLMQKVAIFALGALALGFRVVRTSHQFSSSIGLLGCSLLHTNPAAAQMPALGEFRINTVTMGDQQHPALAPLLDGGFVVAWHSEHTGDWDIWGQRYDISGVLVGSEFRINTVTTSHQRLPTLAALAGGGFVAAWVGAQTGNSDIYALRFDAAGTAVGSEFLINTDVINDQGNPTLSALSDGSIVAAWDGGQDGNYNIYGQKYAASGGVDGPELLINANMTNDQRYPSLAALRDGEFVAAWEGYQTGDYEVCGQKYDVSGAPVGSEFRINTNVTRSQESPTLTGLTDMGFVAAWQGDQTGDYDIYGQRYDASGAAVRSEFRINTVTTSRQQFPSLATLTGGGFVAAWQGFQTGDWEIYGQRFDVSGAAVGSEFRINTISTNNQERPTLAALSDGGFVAAWQGDQTGGWEIYGQRYNGSGSPVLNFSLSSSFGMGSSTIVSTPAQSTSSQAVSSNTLVLQPSPSQYVSSTNNITPSSMRVSQKGSSSAQAPSYSSQPSTVFGDSTASSTSPPPPNSLASPSSSQTNSVILSITEISYGTLYPINVNGGKVGTFKIIGGTGLFDAAQSSVLNIQIDPGADLSGPIALFTFASSQGEFQSIEIVGESCQILEGNVAPDGSEMVFEVIFAGTSCAPAARTVVTFFPVHLT